MKAHNYYEQLWEYLLLISPPEDTRRSIGKIKKEIGIKYGSTHALHSSAYISLVKFMLVKGYEKNLLEQLFGFCINRFPFEVVLNNFGVFPRHTLYISVQENEGLKKLQNGLTMLLAGLASGIEKYMNANRKHHMTIARSLNPEQFTSISDEYKSREINVSFRARNIVLLKRPYEEYNSNFCRWSGNHNFVMGY